ncbi:MAG: glycosyltransferase family 2 protein [Patescibacteria group bacterium]|nr:glycosyltransferase family 2 protein [Patescibacteria group bacterium]
MTVTISLLNYNKKKYLTYCLDSILEQSYQDIEIFFVDNNSTDNSFEYLKSYAEHKYPLSKIRFIRNQKNLGYSKAHNEVIKQSNGKFVLCLNPDIILDKDYIKNCLEILNQNPKIGAITGKLFKWKFSQNKQTNIIDSCGHRILKTHRITEWGSNQKNSQEFETIKKIFSVSGAAPIYRKEALENIKYNNEYFDESFFAYKEDIDLSWRLLHAGWEIWFDHKSHAWHDRWETGTENSTLKVIKQRNKKTDFINKLSYRNHLLLLYKNEFASNFLIYFPWIFFYELGKFFYTLFHEPKNLSAIIDLFKLCKLTKAKRNAIIKNSKIKPKDIRKYIH